MVLVARRIYKKIGFGAMAIARVIRNVRQKPRQSEITRSDSQSRLRPVPHVVEKNF